MQQSNLEKKLRWLFDTNSIIKLVRSENAAVYEKLKEFKLINYVSKITILEYPKSSKTYKNFQIIDLNRKITDKALEMAPNVHCLFMLFLKILSFLVFAADIVDNYNGRIAGFA